MPVAKQAFYEGAALYGLIRSGAVQHIIFKPPFFIVNNEVFLFLKYSTKPRSPWPFTFTASEQLVLRTMAADKRVMIGLICGGDGVAAVPWRSYSNIASIRASAIHISCRRQHGEHYEVNGPDGVLMGKIAPSVWSRMLKTEELP